MVEHLLAKENVESSNLFIRSLKTLYMKRFLIHWDKPKINIGNYWLVNKIDFAIELSLMALNKRASRTRYSWELLVIKQISARFRAKQQKFVYG